MKRTWIVWLLMLIAIAAFGQGKPKPAAKAKVAVPCVAGENEKCPTESWLAGYRKLIETQTKYAPPQEVQDYLAGLQARLQREIPAGYNWDPAKEVFVKPAAPTPPAPPAAKPADAPKGK